jgi:crossover junction endodeoxyribonuclease RuvC
MKTMGVDQSYTSTGIVVIDDGDIVDAAIVSSQPSQTIHDRAYHIASEVVKMATKHTPCKIVIEGLAFGMRGSATRDLAGLQFAIFQHLRFTGRVYATEIVSPTTLKKFATGSGKASKSDMKAAVSAADLIMLKSFQKVNAKQLADLVDAYWLATYS